MRKWLVFLFLLLIIAIGSFGVLQKDATHGVEVEDNPTISVDS